MPFGLPEALAIASALPELWALFRTKTPELEPEFWHRYYSPARIEMGMAPIREALRAREAAESGRQAELWGGRGLSSGAAARAGRRAISEETSRALSEALGRATQAEMGRATQLGLTQFQSDLAKAMQEKGALSHLATTMAAPYFMKKGFEWGAGKGLGETTEKELPTTKVPVSQLSPANLSPANQMAVEFLRNMLANPQPPQPFYPSQPFYSYPTWEPAYTGGIYGW